ncbi:50S ribosomal protein L11 methyltransferase [Pseudomonas aeruginosa]|nr:50S ribosomal protein L11 methyltransferase [Pseudomonas aeruginosa]
MERIRRWYRQSLAAATEAATCFALGFRESLQPAALFRSASLCILVSVLCTWLFVHFFEPIIRLCGWAALYTAFSVANFALIPSGSLIEAGSGGPYFDPLAAFNGLAGLAQLAFYFVGYAALFFVALYAASIVFGIRLGLRIGLLGQLKEQVRQRYPRLAPASGERISLWRAAGFRLAPWLGVSGSILVGLLVPLYNGVLLLLALAYLNIRFLLPATLAGLADAGEQLAVLRARRGSLLLFGLLILLLALVPLLNLLLPAVLGGGTCHLANRGLAQLRGEATAEWQRRLASSKLARWKTGRPWAARFVYSRNRGRPMPWLQVRLAITPEQAETYEDALLEVGAVSVTFMDAEDQPIFEPDLGTTPLWSRTHLLALFEADTDETALLAHLALLTGGDLPEHHVEEIADQDWERSWMDNFQPMRFGRRLWIVPSWHAAPEPDAVNLLLDPGLAFGTGTHPTTALCLEWLDGQELAGRQVLDFGCGSGILAIAALLLGAERAVGTDIDPQALEASRDNASRNGIEPARFPVYLPADLPQRQADVLVANILAGPLVSLAPQLTDLVRPGGLLALSGILAEQAAEVRAAYSAHFDLDPTAEREGWIRISGRRRAD